MVIEWSGNRVNGLSLLALGALGFTSILCLVPRVTSASSSPCPVVLLSVLDAPLAADFIEETHFGSYAGQAEATRLMRDLGFQWLGGPESWAHPDRRAAQAYWQQTPWGRDVLAIPRAAIQMAGGQPVVAVSARSLIAHIESGKPLPALTHLRLNGATNAEIRALRPHLTQLRHLDVGLTAVIADRDFFRSLPEKLRSLVLPFNADDGRSTVRTRALASALENRFRELTHLSLGYTGVRISPGLLNALAGLSRLTHLDLQNRDGVLTPEYLAAIPLGVHELDLSHLDCSALPDGALALRLRQMRNLTRLSLRYTAWNADARFFDSLPEGLRLLDLERLGRDRSSFDQAALNTALRRRLRNLRILVVSDSGVAVDDAFFAALPPSLERLELNSLPTGGPGLRGIDRAALLRGLPRLVFLNQLLLENSTVRADRNFFGALPPSVTRLRIWTKPTVEVFREWWDSLPAEAQRRPYHLFFSGFNRQNAELGFLPPNVELGR